jgi:hypothetical protein
VVPTVLNAGIDRKIMMKAIKKMMKSTAFLKKLYRVGSTLSFLAAPRMNLPIMYRRMRDTMKETIKTANAKMICSQYLSEAFISPKILITQGVDGRQLRIFEKLSCNGQTSSD